MRFDYGRVRPEQITSLTLIERTDLLATGWIKDGMVSITNLDHLFRLINPQDIQARNKLGWFRGGNRAR